MAVLLVFQVFSSLAATSDWLAHPWQSDEGLPDNSVSGICQTPDSFLWVATAGGLMQFDGVRFQEAPLLNLEGVPNHVVRALAMDRHGRLWLGMDRGPIVSLASGEAEVFTNGVPDAQAIVLADDDAGGICIAYSDGRVARIDSDGRAQLMTEQQGLPREGNCWLATDVSGRLWFAKDHSLGIFQDSRFHSLVHASDPVGCIGRRRGGGIWVAAGKRIFRYTDGEEDGAKLIERCRLPADAEETTFTALLEDRSGALWVGTSTAGLFRDNGTELERMPTSHREITSLLEDAEGNIWAGTAGAGLNRIRQRVVELLGTGSGLPFESVRSLCQDSTGSLWAVLENGALSRRDTNLWHTVSRGSHWPGGHALCVAADKEGRIWVGMRDNGLWCLDRGEWSGFHPKDGLASDNVRSLLVASNGDIWATTDSPTRIQRFHGGKFEDFDLASQTRSLRALTEDASGDVWIGSSDGQLFRIHQSQVFNETARISNPRLRSIRCLYATPDGAVWIGYAGWGIGYVKGTNYLRITQAEGLYDDYVSQIVADGHGWLWCASNKGIFQVRVQDLKNWIEHRTDRVRSIIHGRGEDLPSLQPNFENAPGAIAASDGRLWFPMRTGLAVANTGNLQRNALPPPVVLNRIAADGQTVALYDARSPLNVATNRIETDLSLPGVVLRLGPSHRKLDIEFTALSYTAPENVHFQYRLENFDEGWIDSDVRNATYPRLPAGDYLFRVTACNNDGVWNQQGAVLKIVVSPFFWQTWWFRVLLIALFTIGLVAVVRYVSFRRLRMQLHKLEQQAALHHERARIARDIHDDLGANLTQIALLGELAQQDSGAPDRATGRIAKISNNARQAIKSLDEIIWAVNPRNDTLAHLVDYAGQFALDYLADANMRCRFDLPDQLPDREVSTDIRHNLFLAVKETLNNIVKHSRATEVWLRVRLAEESLTFIVEDNGRGFESAPDNGLADGLRNIQQRLENIGGTCRIESHVDAGTVVTFEVPWIRKQ